MFLEFTRTMDNPDNMQEACQAKGLQYQEAMAALDRAQRRAATKHPTTIRIISTAPLIFGVRGTVLFEEAREGLLSLNLTPAELDKVLAQGVRAAMGAAADMCAARFAAQRALPRVPHGADGKCIKLVIPPKPFKPTEWQGDRGGTGTTASKRTRKGTWRSS